MATQVKAGKKSKKKPIPVKTSLNSPFEYRWSPLETGHMQFILSTLKDRMSEIGLKKRYEKVFRKWEKKKKSKKRGEPTNQVDVQPIKQDKTPGWTDIAIRKQLAIGINEVTKGLERNELCLVLVCNSVRPRHMTQHLIPLSKTRFVPACQVPRLSENLADVMGLKCLLAIGFKRGTSAFTDTVATILPKVPALEAAWVPTGEDAPAAVQEQEVTETTENVEVRGQKRKLEDSFSDSLSPSISLQPLKVKRIVPNPSKSRKPKKGKVK